VVEPDSGLTTTMGTTATFTDAEEIGIEADNQEPTDNLSGLEVNPGV